MPGAYQIAQIPLPSGVWTAIVMPIYASYFSFKSQNNSSIRMRTDFADATTEDLLPGGYQEVQSTPMVATNPCARWPAGTILFYAQPSSGSDVAIFKYS